MTRSLSCASCEASLEYAGSGRTMKCPYCGTMVEVPEESWQAVEQEQTVNQWKKHLIVFLAVTVGLPTCMGLLASMLGVFGTLLGIGAGISGGIIPFILHIFVR